MTTINTLVSDSLRLLGVMGETDSLSSEQGSLGLRVINRMLEQWTEEGVELGWFEQSDGTASAPLPKWSEMGVVSKLAQAMRAYYPASTLENWVMNDDLNGYGTLLRRVIQDQLEGADMTHMPSGSGKFGSGWDITSG